MEKVKKRKDTRAEKEEKKLSLFMDDRMIWWYGIYVEICKNQHKTPGTTEYCKVAACKVNFEVNCFPLY